MEDAEWWKEKMKQFRKVRGCRKDAEEEKEKIKSLFNPEWWLPAG